MPDSISDSEYTMLTLTQRLGLPLMANGGAEILREGRTGVPLSRVAHQLACSIRSLHELWQQSDEAATPLIPTFRNLVLAYLCLYNMRGAAQDETLPQRLLMGYRVDLDTWLLAVARDGDVHGTASLDSGSPSRRRR